MPASIQLTMPQRRKREEEKQNLSYGNGLHTCKSISPGSILPSKSTAPLCRQRNMWEDGKEVCILLLHSYMQHATTLSYIHQQFSLESAKEYIGKTNFQIITNHSILILHCA